MPPPPSHECPRSHRRLVSPLAPPTHWHFSPLSTAPPQALGADAEVFANLTADAWTAMRSFLLLASACKEPTGAELNPLLKDVVAAMGAVDKAIKRNDWELHGKVCLMLSDVVYRRLCVMSWVSLVLVHH